MKKRRTIIISSIIAGLVLIGIACGRNNQTSSQLDSNTPTTSISASASQAAPTSATATPAPAPTPTCDGTSITTNCKVDTITYATYIYHPAVAEKSHEETTTTYTTEITGYCTACNDGTRSPSCATGRGTCSHHGGVREWNAPVYSQVAHNATHTVVDSPAQAAYYEKVTK